MKGLKSIAVLQLIKSLSLYVVKLHPSRRILSYHLLVHVEVRAKEAVFPSYFLISSMHRHHKILDISPLRLSI